MTTLLCIVTLVSYYYSSGEIVRNTSHYQQSLLKELSAQVKIQLDAIEQISLAASRNATVHRFLETETAGYERTVLQIEAEYFLAQITYSSKLIESVDLYMNNAPHTRQDFAVRLIDLEKLPAEPWFPQVESTDFGWTREHLLRHLQRDVKVVSFFRKVYSNLGQYMGALVIHVQADSIRGMMIGQGGGQQVTRQLLDAQGFPIVSTSGAYPSFPWKEYLPFGNGNSGYLKISGDGKQVLEDTLLVWSQLPDSYWTMVELTPYRHITMGSFRMALVLAAIGAISILFALFHSLLLSRQFVKPIRKLLNAMHTFGINTKPVELPTDYTNEFGVLFNGYRRMHERIIELYRSLKRQYVKQKQTELEALQSLINPHFLYNTLDQLNWMAIEEGQEKISRILELTGKMLRIGLSKGESFITIRDELVLLDCYIQIQQIRWEDKLTVEIDVAEELMDCFIPKVTLQPFVENTIIHGFHGRSEGTIKIIGRKYGNETVFIIWDNGIGIDPSRNQARRKTGGYGIHNVKERLEAYFGPHYGLRLSNHGSGTEVKITIPFILQKPENGGVNHVESSDR